MRHFCLVLLSALALAQVRAQEPLTYLMEGEELVLQFTTIIGKTCLIAKAEDGDYLVFRYGTDTDLEFQFPTNSRPHWPQFRFSFFVPNLGEGGETSLDSKSYNYLQFDNKDHKYVVYDEYIQGIRHTGFKVIPLKGGPAKRVEARPETVQGTLLKLRYEPKLETTDELFMD